MIPAEGETCSPVRAAPRRRLPSRARAGLLCALFFYALAQLGLLVVMDVWRLEVLDPECGIKLAQLQARLAEEPGRPLMLFLGSSHVETGLRPEMLTRAGGPILFNFGISGGTCLDSLLNYRRLRAKGIRPDWVIIELSPRDLSSEVSDADTIVVDRLTWKDLALVRQYAAFPGEKVRNWMLERLTPCYSHRFAILGCCAASCLPDLLRANEAIAFHSADRSGWLEFSCNENVPRSEYRRWYEATRREYEPCLRRFLAAGSGTRILQDLLEECQREGIHVGLLLMPANREFLGWYSSEGSASLDRYLCWLSRTYDVPIVDARTWSPDPDFRDGHHLTYQGAAHFTERFGREGLPVLLQERSPGYEKDRP
jgi:hypothetical protein